MKKNWLYPTIAGIALLATACANNAAPNYTRHPGTTTNQAAPAPAAPRVTNFDGIHTRNYDGMHTRNIDGFHTRSYDGTRQYGFDGMGVGNVAGTPGTTNNYSTYTNGTRPYHAFTDGTRGYNTYGTNTDGMHGSSYYRTKGTTGTTGTMSTIAHKGYVQVDRSHVRSASTNQVHVDRDALARAVGNVTASCPGVNRSTVYVTDKEIFVGLDTNGQDGQTANAQARANALSVSPRYYKVYVSNHPQTIAEINRCASRTSNTSQRPEDTRLINDLIKRMGGVPSEQMTTRGSNMTTQFQGTTHKTNAGTTSR